MPDTPSLESLAVAAAKWCGWEIQPPLHSDLDAFWETPGNMVVDARPGFLLDMAYGGALLLAAIKRKLVEEGWRYGVDRIRDDVVVVLRKGETVRAAVCSRGSELGAFLRALHAAKLVTTEDE